MVRRRRDGEVPTTTVRARLRDPAHKTTRRMRRALRSDPSLAIAIKRRNFSEEDVQGAIDFVEANPAAHDALLDDIAGLSRFRRQRILFDELPPKERPLLRWLWEHREEILAFILKVAGMFGFVPKGV